MKPPDESGVEGKPAPPNSGGNPGWFKAMRELEPLELIKANPLAFVLAYVIAHRSRYHVGFNRHNLALGEALLGDFKSYGMSERQYRTAKEQLAKWGFATFRTTNKGTIGKLTDTRLFSVFRLPADGRKDEQVTDSRRTADGQPTTNKISKNDKSNKSRRDPANFIPQ